MPTSLVSTGVQFPDSSIQTTAATAGNTTPIYRTKFLIAGTTYTVPADTKALYVFVTGAVGGTNNVTGAAGSGGGGYSETYYASPAASYSYALGAAGTTAGTDGGTTTFGAMSVTGSGGSRSGAPAQPLGGVGSGGTFNATGGKGGIVNVSFGGGGASASRAGNGFDGGPGNTTGTGGGGGGTSSAGLTNGVPGGAALVKAAGAITLPFTQNYEYFTGGENGGGSGVGGNGASSLESMNVFMPYVEFQSAGSGRGGTGTAPGKAGLPGFIWILEVLK
jgi:hypothetical protein